MEHIDHASAAACVWQTDFAEVAALVYGVGKFVLASLVVLSLLRVYACKMRALGAFPSGPREPKEAGAARDGHGIAKDDHKYSDGNNHEKDREREAVVVFLKAFARFVLLRWSVGGFVWLAQEAFSAATGDELPLSGYVFLVAVLGVSFTSDLFPTLRAKIVLSICSLMRQCYLALLGALIVRVQRMLRSASCAVLRTCTFRNMLRADQHMAWSVSLIMWTKLSTAGAVVCTSLWVIGKVLSDIFWIALCIAGRRIVDAAGLLKRQIAARWQAAGRDDFQREQPTTAVRVPVRIVHAPFSTHMPVQPKKKESASATNAACNSYLNVTCHGVWYFASY